MIEAVENHMPEVIVIDEIGTELEAAAARTIAERGVQLIGTAHGNNLDNLMLNPTLSDLIGGIQSVTLGDEEARRRRTQKSVLERKAPPTFDVVVEIQDRDRVTVHADVAETVDALLRGDPMAPELRWRDEGGVHRTQARPRPRPTPPAVRASASAGSSGAGLAAGASSPAGALTPARAPTGAVSAAGGLAPPRGRTGGWRAPRGRTSSGQGGAAGPRRGGRSTTPDARDRSLAPPSRTSPTRAHTTPPSSPTRRSWPARSPTAARSSAASRCRSRAPGTRASWSASASGGNRARQAIRALDAQAAPDGQAQVVEEDEDLDDALDDDAAMATRARRSTDETSPRPARRHRARWLRNRIADHQRARLRHQPQAPGAGHPRAAAAGRPRARRGRGGRRHHAAQPLPPEAAALREAEERRMPIFVLKSNTIVQMQACLTSLFALEVDPREAALREVEEAIGLVMRAAKPVELSPQNAYIRRLQHQMAERANLVSQSRGREPYRRVRLYPSRSGPGAERPLNRGSRGSDDRDSSDPCLAAHEALDVGSSRARHT